jgi:hypothetical protein
LMKAFSPALPGTILNLHSVILNLYSVILNEVKDLDSSLALRMTIIGSGQVAFKVKEGGKSAPSF